MCRHLLVISFDHRMTNIASTTEPRASNRHLHLALVRGYAPSHAPPRSLGPRPLHHSFRPAVVLAPPSPDERGTGVILRGALHLRDFLVNAELLAGAQERQSWAVYRVLELVRHLAVVCRVKC